MNTNLSPLNQAYLNNPNARKEIAAANPVYQTKTEGNKKLKLALAGLAVGGAVIAGIAVGKYKKAQQLAELIEFKPAQSLEEAKEFAQKHLKIKNYELENLDSANYVNEALVNYNNNISTNHRRIIKNITGLKNTEDTNYLSGGIFAVGNYGNTLEVNEGFIKNLPEEIQDLIKTTKDKGFIGEKRAEHFLEAISENDLKSNFELYDKIGNIAQCKVSTDHMFANLISNNNVQDFLKNNPALPQTIEDFIKLSDKEKLSILKSISENTKTMPNINIEGGPFRLLNHELGHLAHRDNVGHKLFYEYGKYVTSANGEIDNAACTEKFKKEIGDALSLKIQSNISLYAATTPAEFVAETYSYLCNGVKFSDEIMDLYKKYGGVIPKCAISK